MSARSRVFLAALVAVACATPSARAQDDNKDQPPSQLQIERLLADPDRKDFKCDLAVSPSHLTFQQRNLVQVTASLDPSAEDRKNALDLYFVVKVADATGKWLPDDTHRWFKVPAGFDKDSAIQYSTGFYTRPGKYTAALIVVDASSGKTDLLRKSFEVKPLKNDPLPQLGRDLPPVDFVTSPPTEEPPVSTGDHYGRHFRLPEFAPRHPEDEWPPAHGAAYLPVSNPRPLLVDIVLNIAPPANANSQTATSESRFRATAGAILQAGAILSDLRLRQGCVEVSAIDLSQLQVVFERMPVREADWANIAKQVKKRNNATISIKALGNKTATGDFLGDYMGKIAGASDNCAGDKGTMDHAVLFVSRNFEFPSGTRGAHLDPQADHPVRYFLLRISRGAGGDDLLRFFKPVNPVKYDASSPEEFRGVLAKLVADLSGGGQEKK